MPCGNMSSAKRLQCRSRAKIQDELEIDRGNGPWVEAALPEAAWKTCLDLARKHGPRLGIRALDTRHVASALEFGGKAFWTFDERLSQARYRSRISRTLMRRNESP